jgi:hypothetical protein
VGDFAPGGWHRAAGPDASAVSGGECPPLGRGEEPGGASEVENFGARAEHDGNEFGVGSEAAGSAGADGLLDAGDGGGADSGLQDFERHGHEHRDTCAGEGAFVVRE